MGIITNMERRRPEIIFSTLTGIVMLIFMTASLTDRELFRFHLNLGGFSFGLGVTSMELLIPLAAVITDLGMYHALRISLPVSKEQIILHLFLPFAVTLTIGFTLRDIGGGLTGWGLLFLTGGLLYLVLRFEYTACDPGSIRRPVSIIILDGLCYAVFLLFCIALRAIISSHPFITMGAIFVLCTVVSLKIYSFHIINGNIPALAAVTGAVILFSEAGLHFWPVNIVSYGSLMFIWYYTFTSLVIGMDRDEPFGSIFKRVLPATLPALGVLGYAMFLM